MIDTMDLSKFKTGLDLEKEFNRIVLLARNYEMNHIEAEKMLTDIYDYGVKSGKFSKKNHKSYMGRRNCHKNGKLRTHLEFAFNLYNGQMNEHKTFLYLLEWTKSRHRDKKITWELNGSDLEAYMMIVSFKNGKKGKNGNCPSEPDYRLDIDDRSYLIEAKSFITPPTLKIINLEKYEQRKSYIIIQYLKRYYLFRTPIITHLLKVRRENNWKQKTIELTQADLDKLVETSNIMEIKNV